MNKFKAVVDAVGQLKTPSEPKKKRPIGFEPWEEKMMLPHWLLVM
jgi:hypothetical protein